MKKQALKFLFLSVTLGGMIYSTASQSVADTNKPVKNGIISTYSKDHATAIDFQNDKKAAVKWSNKHYPRIADGVQTSEKVDKIIAMNKDLRRKYLNRSEFYEPQKDLTTLDQEFVTEAREDLTLYVNLAMEDFQISTTYFIKNPDKVFNEMLNNTQYGIDSGYLLGDLTQKPIDSTQEESIQLEVVIPKGTPLIRVEGGDEAKFMLPRNQTFEYTNKKLDKSKNTPEVHMNAELVDRDQLTQATEEKQTLINNQLMNDFHLQDGFIKLLPLGLNAGNILVNSQEVATTSFTILKDKNILTDDMFANETLIMTDGFFGHTEVLDIQADRGNFTPEERRAYFEEQYNEGKNNLGATLNWRVIDSEVPEMSITTLYFSHLTDRDALTNINNNANLSATTLHEFFHYLYFISDNFKDRPMFEGNPNEFKSEVKSLAEEEGSKLADLLNDDYAMQDWKEFICEAFMAKNHPEVSIQTEFQEKLVKTNRFLDNIYDFEAPSVPNNLKSLDIEGDSVDLTFDHSRDAISVDKYIVYQDGEFVRFINTEKDENGLSYANPAEHMDNEVFTLSGLTPYTDYTFEVFAVDEAGNESAKSTPLSLKTKDTEAPELKGSLMGTVLSSNTAGFNWPEPTDNVGVEKIILHRKESDTNAPSPKEYSSEKTFDLSPTDTNYIDSTIVKGKTYTYYLTALDKAGNESKESNTVTIKTMDSDDEKKNKDKAKDVKYSEATIDWSGSFDGVGASGFNIFGWFKGASGWVFGSLTSVGGDITSCVVNLSPGMPNFFVVVPVDGDEIPLADGLPISVDSVDRSSIQTKDTKIYIGQTWKKEDNFVSATDEDGNPVPVTDERITVTGDTVDTSKDGTYHLTYSFKGIAKTSTSDCKVRVKWDDTVLKLRNQFGVYANESLDLNSVIYYAYDKDLNKLRAEDVNWYVDDSWVGKGDEVKIDTSKSGEHWVQIEYPNAYGEPVYSNFCKIIVRDPRIVFEDDFLSEKESAFSALSSDESWVHWKSDGDENGVSIADARGGGGIMTKQSLSLLGDTDYGIYIDSTLGGFIEITDADTGEVYLSKDFSNDPTQKIPISFSKDTNINVRLTSPLNMDTTFYSFILEKDTDNK